MDYINSYALNIDLIACKDCGKTKEEIIEYLQYPELVVMYNTQRLETYKFDKDFIVSESKIHNTHVDATRPQWGSAYIKNNQVEDETVFF
jgi:hypothetical protein